MVGVSQASIIGIQAESGTFDSGDFLTVSQADINAAGAPLNTETLGGGSAIQSSGNRYALNDANKAKSADYSFTVADAGSYTLWARIITTDGEGFSVGTNSDIADGNDSFYYSSFNADGSTYSTLTQNAVVNDALYVQLGAAQALTTGLNTFSVLGREDGMILDAFIVTDEAYNEAAFDAALAIPEPATLGLIGAFGGGLLFVRRRFLI